MAWIILTWFIPRPYLILTVRLWVLYITSPQPMETLLSMDHQDHVNLLQPGVTGQGGIWADFGSGRGAFTLALADLIGPLGEIYSIDKDESALKDQERAMRARFPERDPDLTNYLIADFTQPINLPPLDGAVMANALHFKRHKEKVLALLYAYLRPRGRLILVEYNIDRGNPWVPYPISYPNWEVLAQKCGFNGTQLLATHPSRTFNEIYSAVSFKPPAPHPPSNRSSPR
jgi:ubiquinone/menaquinone biosynthesis C-methylase UbiE